MSRQCTAKQLLEGIGIDTSSPGFYDDHRFIEAEKRDARFLRNYARFIREQSFQNDYLKRAEQIIATAVNLLYDALLAENQHGKCIDGSMVLMRMLERQGVWSYAAKGALTIFFAPETSLPTTYFAPIMHASNPAKAGHVWLYAPPFVVVDVATQLQPYLQSERQYLPPFLLAKELKPCRISAEDLIEPEAREQFVRELNRRPTMQDADKMSPGVLHDVKELGSGEVEFDKAILRYAAIGVSAPLESLEDWRNLRLRGKYPIELYADFEVALEKKGI